MAIDHVPIKEQSPELLIKALPAATPAWICSTCFNSWLTLPQFTPHCSNYSNSCSAYLLMSSISTMSKIGSHDTRHSISALFISSHNFRLAICDFELLRPPRPLNLNIPSAIPDFEAPRSQLCNYARPLANAKRDYATSHAYHLSEAQAQKGDQPERKEKGQTEC